MRAKLASQRSLRILFLQHEGEEFYREPEEGVLNDMHRRSSLPAFSVLLYRLWGQP